MSRTYRKPRTVVTKTKDRYIHEFLTSIKNCSYHREYYICPEMQRAYDKDVAEYKANHWGWSGNTAPKIYAYESYRIVKDKIDIDHEIEILEKQYDRYYRDSRHRDTMEYAHQKHHRVEANRKFRQQNRQFARRIMKDDWEDLPLPINDLINWWDYY